MCGKVSAESPCNFSPSRRTAGVPAYNGHSAAPIPTVSAVTGAAYQAALAQPRTRGARQGSRIIPRTCAGAWMHRK